MKPEPRGRSVRRNALAMAAAWTLLLAASAVWYEWNRQRDLEEAGRIQARTAFDMDLAYRHWNAMHSGVYAPITPETTPNPNLAGVPEKALQASEARLKEAQRLAQIGSWSLDLETEAITWSEEMYRIYGRDPKLPAPSFKELPTRYTPESYQRIESAIKQSVATGQPWETELELVRPDGTHRWAVGRGEPISDAVGRVVRLHGTVQDITGRKQAAEALRQSEERARRRAEELQKLMDVVPAAIWVAHDPQCRLITGNKVACTLFEAREGENVSVAPAPQRTRHHAPLLPRRPRTGPYRATHAAVHCHRR